MAGTDRNAHRARAVGALALALGALVAGGCGSSGATSASSSASTAARAPSGSGTTAGGSSLKAIGTPKWATPSKSAPVQSGVVHVTYHYITIHPDTLRVRAGTTIVWSNEDPVEHNVTSEGGPQRFGSGNFGQGASFQVKLTRPGLVHYECTNHPASMNGSIEVVS
jgi:plastocyanin